MPDASVALMVCEPDVDDGIVMIAVKSPVEFVLTVLGVVASVVLSYFIVIVEVAA